LQEKLGEVTEQLRIILQEKQNKVKGIERIGC